MIAENMDTVRVEVVSLLLLAVHGLLIRALGGLKTMNILTCLQSECHHCLLTPHHSLHHHYVHIAATDNIAIPVVAFYLE